MLPAKRWGIDMRSNSMCFWLSLSDKVKQPISYLISALVTFLPISALFVIIHEYIHSTTAWLLGAKENPMIIQWGNLVTLAGWDEDVCYSCLFDSGQGTVAAVIAASPLIFQAAVFIVCLYLMLGDLLLKKRLMFHVVFWVAIINFMELFQLHSNAVLCLQWRYWKHQPWPGTLPLAFIHGKHAPGPCWDIPPLRQGTS